MEIISILSQYLDPLQEMPLQEMKPLKAPDCEQDVRRFEAILSGEGPYQPKSLDLVMPATEPNAVQTMGDTILNKVSTMKKSIDNRTNRMDALFENAESLEIGDLLRLQWQVAMFDIETSLITKSGDKAGEGIKTLFRNQ